MFTLFFKICYKWLACLAPRVCLQLDAVQQSGQYHPPWAVYTLSLLPHSVGCGRKQLEGVTFSLISTHKDGYYPYDLVSATYSSEKALPCPSDRLSDPDCDSCVHWWSIVKAFPEEQSFPYLWAGSLVKFIVSWMKFLEVGQLVCMHSVDYIKENLRRLPISKDLEQCSRMSTLKWQALFVESGMTPVDLYWL